VSGRSHDESFIHYTEHSEMLLSSHTNKKSIPGAIPNPVRYRSHQRGFSGISSQSPFCIPPTGLATTGFNGIKTDAGIPFHTRGGIPPEALPAKASGRAVYTAWGVTRFFGFSQLSEDKHVEKSVIRERI
jgi:hypothetical protein